jgi:hypothetical protein
MKAGAAAAFTAGAADPEGGPLAYSWKVDNQTAGGNNNTFVFRPASPGAYRIAVTVSDGEQGASYEWGVTVSAAGGGASDEQGDSTMAMAGIIAVVAVLVAVIALLARKKK